MKIDSNKNTLNGDRLLWFLLSMVTLMWITGCASYMHGYTQQRANERYLLVDKENESFGYNRMQYNLGFNRSLKGFVNVHGMPDFIYEYENSEGRDSIRMYYVEEDIVYVYESQSWMADSLYLKEYRPLSEYEIATYKELKKGGL